MVKFIYYLIFCCTVLLYCCGERNTLHKKPNSKNISNTTTSSIITDDVQTSEQQIFDTLMHAFKKSIENNKQWSMEKKERYKQFEIWLLQDTQKQKQLTDHFKYLYTLLEKIKPQSAHNITIKQLIENTIECITSDTCDSRNDVYSQDQSDYWGYGRAVKCFLKIYYLTCLTYLIVLI